MSETRIGVRALGDAAGADRAALPLQRVVLDSRSPQLLDHHGYGMQVVAGHVDLFAVSRTDERTEGARHHLFRVERGEIILDLPEAGEHSSERVQVVAVGGPGAEALVLPRQQIETSDPIATWIARLGQVITGHRVDWTICEAEADAIFELTPGERRRGSAHDIAWISVDTGIVRLMGLEPAYRSSSAPAPLTSGMWIEAGEAASTVSVSGRMPSGELLWRAIDQFHACAMACIRCHLAADADKEARRLLRRIQLAGSQTSELFEDLSAVIVRPPPDRDRPSADTADPLLSACRAVADAIQSAIVRPPERMSLQQDFGEIVEIARASRLRVRRTLLRGNWWDRDVGPLVAWHGHERNPVALIPASRRHYVMFEPSSGARRVVNGSIAAEFAPEAATFYPALHHAHFRSGICSPSQRHARGNAVRIILGAVLLGLLSLVTPLITQVLVDSVIPRTELDQLIFCAAALAVTAIAMAGAQMMQGVAMLRLEGVLD